ncbi:radical SAM protein [Anaerostipes faecalis]|uniref:radical SAM protein n=1 Tax=Anaerostipes faecalis TaxID=2738446 RepID=UPI003F031855
MRYEGMIYRPPSEAYSLILQVTIGCSQNQCMFCNMYKEKIFRIRKIEEVLEDLAVARVTYHQVNKIFLADGDALICKTDYLKTILEYIQINFPECHQVTSYASPKSVLLKNTEELKLLRQSGLSMVYLGLESGNTDVLKFMKKGVSSEEMIEASKRIHDASISLSVTAISGLGGRYLWREHAEDTGKVLSMMKPEYVGLLTLMIEEDMPLFNEIEKGKFHLMSPYDILIETKKMLQNMDCPGCIFRSNHASNYLNLRGTLNDDKRRMISLLDEAIEGNIPLKSEWGRGL